MKYAGIVNHLEHHYRQYRKQGTSNAGMDEHLKKVMVEYDCPECGGARLKRARRLVTIEGRNLFEVGEMHLAELLAFLKSIKPTARQRPSPRQSCEKSPRDWSCSSPSVWIISA